MKLVWKLTLFNTFIVSITILSLFWIFYKSMERGLLKAQQYHLKSFTKAAEAKVGRWPIALRRFFVKINGVIINDPFGIGPYLDKEEGIVKIGDEYFLVVTSRKENKEISLAANITPLVKGINAMAKAAFITSILGIILSFLIAFLLSRYSLRPIKNLAEELSKIGGENLNTRLNVPRTNDELQQLATEINSMLERIEKAYKIQERFVHDVSHELRNPLASMKGFIGVLKKWGKKDEKIFDEAVSELEELIHEMQTLVENLLLLAKPQEMLLETVEVKKLVEELIKRLQTQRKLEVSIEGDHELRTSGEHFKIIVKNLLENAFKYAKSHVDVKITKTSLEVTDDGPGISKEDMDKIFERFYRGDTSRDRRVSGYGLGLSIVKELTEKLGMDIEVESEEGKGTTFRIIWGENA